MQHPPIEVRLFCRVSTPNGRDGCWIWKGTKTRRGYGMVHFEGYQQYTHRVAYQLTYGEIPIGMDICHRCDVPSCINPKHLFCGTRSANMRDAFRKGRTAGLLTSESTSGEHNPKAKLSAADVLAIRSKRRTGVTNVSLARSYGVTKETISMIVRGVTWKHLPV